MGTPPAEHTGRKPCKRYFSRTRKLSRSRADPEISCIASARRPNGIHESVCRSPYRNQPKWQLPMWHRYRVELYPHYVDLPIALQRTGIRDEFGNDLHFPAAFRKSRREHKPKGIVKIRH